MQLAYLCHALLPQVWAGAIPAAPGGALLNATFKSAESFEFQDGLGRAVVSACEAIPDGVLLFVPSYQLMDKLVKRWKVGRCWLDAAAAGRSGITLSPTFCSVQHMKLDDFVLPMSTNLRCVSKR